MRMADGPIFLGIFSPQWFEFFFLVCVIMIFLFWCRRKLEKNPQSCEGVFPSPNPSLSFFFCYPLRIPSFPSHPQKTIPILSSHSLQHALRRWNTHSNAQTEIYSTLLPRPTTTYNVHTSECMTAVPPAFSPDKKERGSQAHTYNFPISLPTLHTTTTTQPAPIQYSRANPSPISPLSLIHI